MKLFSGNATHLAARVLACVLVAGGAFGAAPAGALPFSQLFVFGDSLSDSGNNAIALGGTRPPTLIPDNSFVPSFPLDPLPYASGRYTNGAVWAERLGLPAVPALAGGTNFAFGGATTGPLSATPPSLRDQVALFLSGTGGVAPSDALYVIAGGGNNARDALGQILGGADPVATALATAAAYATDVAIMVGTLKAAGADDIIVWNTPDIGLVPAVLAVPIPGASIGATLLAGVMNTALEFAIGGVPGVEIFDVFELLQDIVAAVTAVPGSFGLTNVTDACARFTTCDPSAYLFWDGIHPTSGGHRILAQGMLAVIPEPGSLLLLLAGLAAAVTARRRVAAG